VDLTLNRALPGFTAPKVLWLREQAPETYSAVRKILLPKDYVRYRLTGTFATDVSDASGTLLFDVARRRWSSEVLDALDIPREWLPECFESPEVVAHVSPAAARETAFRRGHLLWQAQAIRLQGQWGTASSARGRRRASLAPVACFFGALTHLPTTEKPGCTHSAMRFGKWHLMGVTLAAGVRSGGSGTLCARSRRSGQGLRVSTNMG